MAVPSGAAMNFSMRWAVPCKLQLDRRQGAAPAQIAEAERLEAEWEPNPEDCEVYAEQAES